MTSILEGLPQALDIHFSDTARIVFGATKRKLLQTKETNHWAKEKIH